LERSDKIQVVGQSSNGLDAVDRSIELQPDIVLLDIQLPKMNGLVAARLIRKACPGTRILFLSSYRDIETMREALRVGHGFVVKSDVARDLLPILEAMIRNEPFLRFRFLRAREPL
jgi:DNA-binding NarL/FixJ family response regulator